MPALPVPINPNEYVVLDSEAVYPRTSLLGLGYNAIFGQLWLTNQRLVFRGTLMGQILDLPLSRVTGAEASDRQIKTKGAKIEGFAAFMTTSSLMVITFDSGGREYFAVKDIAGWTAAILRARPKAPPMEYVSMPSRRPGVEAGVMDLVLWFGGAVAVVCLAGMCCSALTFGAPYLYVLLQNLSSGR
jgi:hypothetical protein